MKKIDISNNNNNNNNRSNGSTTIKEAELPNYFPSYDLYQKKKEYHTTIKIKIKKNLDVNKLKVEIPLLKYNKSILCMIGQDDGLSDTFSDTWAFINNRPFRKNWGEPKLHYSFIQLYNEDLPPNCCCCGRTLGSTDGCGNEVRFSFHGCVLAEEERYINQKSKVDKKAKDNNRFKRPKLNWNDIKELLRYDVGISIHDIQVAAKMKPYYAPNQMEEKRKDSIARYEALHNIDTLEKHLNINQKLTRKHLNGRGCKLLIVPNGNTAYETASENIDYIQTIAYQSCNNKLVPYRNEDLHEKSFHRTFNDDHKMNFKPLIDAIAKTPIEEREALLIGLHNSGVKTNSEKSHQSDEEWHNFLDYLNDTYGKNGNDSI